MTLYRKSIHHAQKVQKRHHNQTIKLRSYTSADKVWLNSKYHITKWNKKLKAKFFRLFWVLHLVDKQAYKLKLPKKWKIYDVFHVSLLEQDTTKKEWVNSTLLELDKGDSKEYEFEVIRDSAVYANKLEEHLPGLYYLGL